jgi:zinc transporter
METHETRCGYLLDGCGGGRSVSWEEVRNWTSRDGTLWLLLHRDDEHAQRWLAEESGIDPNVVDGLRTVASRPRADAIESGLLIVLRCVDPAPAVEPEDLISVRIWCEQHRVVMLYRERPRSLEEQEWRLVQGQGARSSGELVARLVQGVIGRLVTVVETLEDAVDDLEDALVEPSVDVDRAVLVSIRHRIIGLHRYLLPQAHGLAHLETVQTVVLDAKQRRMIKDAAARSMRCVDDLVAARNRGAVIQDELANQLTEHLERRMYTLTVFAAVFLPLTFITGLLGVNLGGIPGDGDPRAFLVLCLMLIVLGALGFVLIRHFKLI